MEYNDFIDIRVLEEISELQKEITKALRFGYKNFHPQDEKRRPNYLRILDEISDLRKALNQYEEFLRLLERREYEKRSKEVGLGTNKECTNTLL